MNKKIVSLFLLALSFLVSATVFAETVSNEYTFDPNFNPSSSPYSETTINVDQEKDLVINIQNVAFVSIGSYEFYDSRPLQAGELRMYDQSWIPSSLRLLSLNDVLISPSEDRTISLHWKIPTSSNYFSYNPARDFYWCFTFNAGFASRNKYIHIHLK